MRGRDGRDGRDGKGRGRSRGRNQRSGRNRGRYNHRPSRDPRAASKSGNKRERIAVESGSLVLIDQFMLANPQFVDQVMELIDEDPAVKDDLIRRYGGTVVELTPGTYRIERDPYKYTIVICQSASGLEPESITETATSEQGHVFVDTRCLAMIDRELLDDTGLLDKYQQLWVTGQEKACRDLLRDNGGAVRYGFRRYGDELGVYKVPEEDIVCLWPDISEPEESAAVQE